MAGVFEVLCGVAVILFLLYQYLQSNYDFWKVRGVKGPKPHFLFGNIKDVMLQKKSMAEYLIEIYNEYKDESFIGIYFRNTPMLVLKDPQLIKDVLIKDFSYFPQRGTPVTEKAEPLSQHLVFLEAARWRPLRNKLSPSFSSGKLKEMFHLILECASHLEDYLNKIPDNDIVEFRELTAKFSTDVIGNCAFGIEMNALADEESEFRKMGREVFKPNLWKTIRFRFRESFPKLYNNLGFIFRNDKITRFFTDTIVQTMDYRKKNNIIRHDFVNILMELKDNPDKLGDEVDFTESLLASQAFVFFAAGFETSSTTMSHALYELAQHQDVQDKLRKEIKEEFKKNDGVLKYETIKMMPYLHAVFQETLRKYPAGPLIFRECLVPSYTFEGTKVTIPMKQKIIIPIVALHRDPTVFPNPDLFDPTRFLNEEKINETTFLPFGRGPRNCIGERFAVYQTKIGLMTFLRNHKVEVCEKTLIPYVIDPASFLFAPKGGIYLKISKVSDE